MSQEHWWTFSWQEPCWRAAIPPVVLVVLEAVSHFQYLPFTEAAQNLALQLSLLWPLLCTWVSPHPSTVLVALGCAGWEGEGGAGVLQRAQTWCGLSTVLLSSCVGHCRIPPGIPSRAGPGSGVSFSSPWLAQTGLFCLWSDMRNEEGLLLIFFAVFRRYLHSEQSQFLVNWLKPLAQMHWTETAITTEIMGCILTVKDFLLPALTWKDQNICPSYAS